MAYLCESCGQSGDTLADLKHDAECKKTMGATKICMKSGTAPHAPDPKK